MHLLVFSLHSPLSWHSLYLSLGYDSRTFLFKHQTAYSYNVGFAFLKQCVLCCTSLSLIQIQIQIQILYRSVIKKTQQIGPRWHLHTSKWFLPEQLIIAKTSIVNTTAYVKKVSATARLSTKAHGVRSVSLLLSVLCLLFFPSLQLRGISVRWNFSHG